MKKELHIHSPSGVYVLVLFLQKDIMLTVGKLGTHKFLGGFYNYTGSALGKGAAGLKQRIARHLRTEKRKFWHIDYLLGNEDVSVEAVVVAGTSKNLECILNGFLRGVGGEVVVEGFGASDCGNRCGSHLLHFPSVDGVDCLVSKVVDYLRSAASVRSVEVVR